MAGGIGGKHGGMVKIPTSTVTAALAAAMTTNPTTTSTASRVAIERKLLCSDGIQLAALHWPSAATATSYSSSSSSASSKSGKKILCLHGWLDNAASFHLLGPALATHLVGTTDEIVALDFPGHGKSNHKSMDAPPQLLAEYVHYVYEALIALNWLPSQSSSSTAATTSIDPSSQEKNEEQTKESGVTLIGHSMGAGISVAFAASFPDHVSNLILLEGMGPLARDATKCGHYIKQACERRVRGNRLLYPQFIKDSNYENNNNDEKGQGGRSTMENELKTSNEARTTTITAGRSGSAMRVYPTLQSAVETRMKTAQLSPGNQYLSYEAAWALVGRATVKASPSLSLSSSPSATVNNEGVTFRHDPRLQWPSLQYFTKEQVESMYRDIAAVQSTCNVCLLWAEDGWPFDERTMDRAVELLQPRLLKRLRGSHHFHADPVSAPEVIDEVVKFLFD